MDASRVLLVDDHVLFRKGLAALLRSQQGLEVVAEAGDGLEALEKAREEMPDIILMDITMPRCDGLEAVKVIKREMPSVHIVMLTVSAEEDDLFAAIKSGAEGYLLKNLEPQQLFDLLAGVQRGEAAISGTVAAKILHEFSRPDDKVPAPAVMMDELTTREADVLRLVAEGRTNREIAEGLCVAENTAKIHLRNILHKLHLRNRVQAAVDAVREGLADAPEST